MKKELTMEEQEKILKILEKRFSENMHRHENIAWDDVLQKLIKKPKELWSIYQMEETEGEPDVIGYNKEIDVYIFCDCSIESPKGRRSLCYDRKALDDRKEHKPKNSAIDMALEIGIEILTEEQYKELQKLEAFDTKTSSWLQTPVAIRKLGGAIFGDNRYEHVYIYHNGADSYYAARGFRGLIRI